MQLSTRDIVLESVLHLSDCFSPRGLRLIRRSPDSEPTSSLLVRGPAGIGKSTLALAIANDLAKDRGGYIAWLSSESGVTDVLSKHEMLGFASKVRDWSDREAAQPGDVVTDPLLPGETAEADTASAKRLLTLEGAWQRLEPLAKDKARLPVVLVIDAFGLLVRGETAIEFREHVLDLVRFCELNGISTIFVEEAANDASDVLLFTCDVVLELLWSEDTRRNRVRRLAIPKSRYSHALPGPHEYGFETGAGGAKLPAAWPDIASAVEFSPALRIGSGSPLNAETFRSLCALPASPYEARIDCKTSEIVTDFWEAMRERLGTTTFLVDAGDQLTLRLRLSGSSPHGVLATSANPQVLLWHMWRHAQSVSTDKPCVLVVRDPRREPRYAPAIEDLVRGARALGLNVIGLEGPWGMED